MAKIPAKKNTVSKAATQKSSCLGMLTCPFTNKAIVIKSIGPDAHVMGVGPFYTTRIFANKQDLINALSTRDGVKPPWAKSNTLSVAASAPRVDPSEVFEGLGDPRKAINEAANGS